MLRDGIHEGWLTINSDAFETWAALNGVDFGLLKAGALPQRGAALLARQLITKVERGGPLTQLLSVPNHLILGRERIIEHSKIDVYFREVLESLGDFGTEPRGAILAFLLTQAAISNPRIQRRVGVHGAFTDYVKSLPIAPLPTFWSMAERDLLIGTSLAPAVTSKLKSLQREYDHLCSSAAKTRWYQAVQSELAFDDWLIVDAMYRSRALDFPGVGHCMVPCIDLANHASGNETVAIYELDANRNATLQLRPDIEVDNGQEVTITYGDEKGACEMLFSYGFLESGRHSAKTLFLSLTIPDDDVLRMAKMRVAECAPGFKLIDADEGQVEWTGDFVWLLCANNDDGFRFEVARTIDGTEEIHCFFDDHELTGGAAELRQLLSRSSLWDVYRLRSVAILQARVFAQMQLLYESQEAVEASSHGTGFEVKDEVFEQVIQLRQLEFELLEQAYESLEKQKTELAESAVVKQYLNDMQDDEVDQEDFS